MQNIKVYFDHTEKDIPSSLFITEKRRDFLLEKVMQPMVEKAVENPEQYPLLKLVDELQYATQDIQEYTFLLLSLRTAIEAMSSAKKSAAFMEALKDFIK